MLSGVAFPRNDAYIKRVDKILPVLKTLKIEVFWVTDSSVKVEGHWELWGAVLNSGDFISRVMS